MLEKNEKPLFRDGMAYSQSSKFYKAIYAIRDKAFQTEGIYVTKGVACSVNVGRLDETTDETTSSLISFVVTWGDVLSLEKATVTNLS